ncbi:MAG: antibiotic biosynthesis monooxygenase [Gemmatimonadetes bacterium]|nr:antibiotic biosynthesis monooxygenase [Gemmatimonadota bacterium]
MFGLIGSFKAVPGKRRELADILLAGVGGMPGCRSYIVAEDPREDDTLWITEVWDSQAAHQASLQLPEVRAAINKGKPLIHAFGEHRETRVVGGHGL